MASFLSATSYHHVRKNASYIVSSSSDEKIMMPMTLYCMEQKQSVPVSRRDNHDETKPVEVWVDKILMSFERMLQMVAVPISVEFMKKVLYNEDKKKWNGLQAFKQLGDIKWTPPTNKDGSKVDVSFGPRDGFKWYDLYHIPYEAPTLKKNGLINFTEYTSYFDESSDEYFNTDPFKEVDMGQVQCYVLLSETNVKEWIESFRPCQEGVTSLNEMRGPTESEGENFLMDKYVDIKSEKSITEFLTTKLPIFYGVYQPKTMSRLALK